MKCENCGAEISENETQCINCNVLGQGRENKEENLEFTQVLINSEDKFIEKKSLSKQETEISMHNILNDLKKYVSNKIAKLKESLLDKVPNSIIENTFKDELLMKVKNIKDYIPEKFNGDRKRALKTIGIIAIILVLIIFINSAPCEYLKLNFYGATSMENSLITYVQKNYNNPKKEQFTLKAIDIIASHNFKNGIDYLDTLFYDKDNNKLDVKVGILNSFDKYKIQLGTSNELCSTYYNDLYEKNFPKDELISEMKLFPPDEIENDFLDQINDLYKNSKVFEAYTLTKDYTDNELGTTDKINSIKPDIDILLKYYFSTDDLDNTEIENKVKEMILKYDKDSIDNECISLIKEQYLKPDLNSSKAYADKYLRNIGSSDNLKKLSSLLGSTIDNKSKISKLQEDNSSIDPKIDDLNKQVTDTKKLVDDTNAKTEQFKKDVSDAQISYNALNSSIINLRFYCTGVASGGDDYTYEIALPTYIYGQEIPSKNHAILKTVDYKITSKGWGNEKVVIDKNTDVTLKDDYGGFTQTWTVYRQFTNADQRSLSAYQTNINDANAKIQENNKTISDLNNKINSIVGGQIKQLNSQKSDLNSQINQLQNQITSNDAEIKSITK